MGIPKELSLDGKSDGRDFNLQPSIVGNQMQEVLYALGAVAALHAITTRLKGLYDAGILAPEQANKILDDLSELGDQVRKSAPQEKDIV